MNKIKNKKNLIRLIVVFLAILTLFLTILNKKYEWIRFTKEESINLKEEISTINKDDSILSDSVDFLALDKVIDYEDGYFLVEKNNFLYIIDATGNLIEELPKEDSYQADLLYDHYYLKKDPSYTYSSDDSIILRRNGNLIKTAKDFISLGEFSLFKDEQDNSSKYISISSAGQIIFYYDEIDKENNIYVTDSRAADSTFLTIIYNAKTGEIINRHEGAFIKIEHGSNVIGYAIDGDGYHLLDDDFEQKPTGYDNIGDHATLEYGETLITNSSKYIAASKDGLYGVIDYDGNVIIEPQYEDLITNENDNYLAVKKDKLYGLVDMDNNILLEFEYDGIEVFKDIIITIKDQKLGVLDVGLNELVENKYDLGVHEYGTRLCCGWETPYQVEKGFNDTYVIKIITNDLNVWFLDEPSDLFLNSAIIINTTNNLVEEYETSFSGFITRYWDDENSNYITVPIINNQDIEGIKIIDTLNQDILLLSNLFQGKEIDFYYTEFINEQFVKINLNYLDDSDETIVIDINTGELLDKVDEYDNWKLNNSYYYSKTPESLSLYSTESLKLLRNINGVDINYLGDNYYTVQDYNEKWYVIELE